MDLHHCRLFVSLSRPKPAIRRRGSFPVRDERPSGWRAARLRRSRRRQGRERRRCQRSCRPVTIHSRRRLPGVTLRPVRSRGGVVVHAFDPELVVHLLDADAVTRDVIHDAARLEIPDPSLERHLAVLDAQVSRLGSCRNSSSARRRCLLGFAHRNGSSPSGPDRGRAGAPEPVRAS